MHLPSCRGGDVRVHVQSYFQVRGDEHTRSITAQNFSFSASCAAAFPQPTEVSAARETEQLTATWPRRLWSHF